MYRLRTLLIQSIIVLVCFAFCSAAIAKEMKTPFEYEVLGWSEDSTLWGFYEKGDYGCGMTYQPGIGFYVIDSVKNAFSYKFSKKVAEQEGESKGVQTIKEWETQSLNKARAMGLKGNKGTVVYEKPKMVWMDFDSRFRQFGEKKLLFNHLKSRYDIKLKDEFVEDRNSLSGKKSMFSLTIRKNNGTWKTLQTDQKPWRPFVAYRILYVSISPDSKKIAVLIEAVDNALEGQKQSAFKGITGLIP